MATPITRSTARRALGGSRLSRFTRRPPRWGGGITGRGRRSGGFRPSVRLSMAGISRRRRGSAGKAFRR